MPEPAKRAVKSEAMKRREAIADVIQTVQRIVRATYRFTRRGLKELGAGGPQVWALMALSQNPRMTVGQLAESMYLHISTVSSLADQLVRHGWAERERSEDDRRVVWLKITDAGRALIARSDVPPRARLPHGLEKLDTPELIRTRKAFLRVSAIMGLLEDPPEPEE
jgi:MarR family transcriptional regulator, organic hydroperoxide resistance regulator